MIYNIILSIPFLKTNLYISIIYTKKAQPMPRQYFNIFSFTSNNRSISPSQVKAFFILHYKPNFPETGGSIDWISRFNIAEINHSFFFFNAFYCFTWQAIYRYLWVIFYLYWSQIRALWLFQQHSQTFHFHLHLQENQLPEECGNPVRLRLYRCGDG